MGKNLFIVSIDSRGKSSSDISCYREHVASQDFFQKHIAGHPDAICYSCKIAKLCGLRMKLYFHPLEDVDFCDESHVTEKVRMNHAATLMTLNPNTGMPEYQVHGVAYATLDSGKETLSLNQVWGIQELINDANDLFEANSENAKLARKELMKNCVLYRYKEWGPLSIYQTRADLDQSKQSLPPPINMITTMNTPKTRTPLHSIQV